MWRRLLRAAGYGVLGLVVLGIVLYALGLRVVLDGGGTPHLQLVASERERAELIARNREAQRTNVDLPASLAAPPVTADPPPPAGGADVSTAVW